MKYYRLIETFPSDLERGFEHGVIIDSDEQDQDGVYENYFGYFFFWSQVEEVEDYEMEGDL